MKIPLTLAIIPALVVTCGGDRYAIPQVSLLELVRLEADEVGKGIEMVHGAPVYRLRGRLLPLVYLNRELELTAEASAETRSNGAVNIVVLQADERQFGLVVDQINDTEEIVVKPLRKQLKTVKTFAGSSIMGDGKVALILDVLGLAQRASVVTETRDRAWRKKPRKSVATTGEKQTFLLFAGPGDSRMAIPLSTLARLEEFPVAQVEMSGSQWVTQYRGQILPLVRLNVVLEETAQQAARPAGPARVGFSTDSGAGAESRRTLLRPGGGTDSGHRRGPGGGEVGSDPGVGSLFRRNWRTGSRNCSISRLFCAGWMQPLRGSLLQLERAEVAN